MARVPSHVSQQTLRKLADRSKGIVLRHEGADPTIAVVGPVVVQAADAMIATYDTARTFELQQLAATEQGTRRLEALHTRIRAWTGLLVDDIASFDAAELEGIPSTPEHLFADAKRIVELVQHQATPLPYAAQLVTDLTEHIERARTDWTTARDAIVRLQELRAEVRAAAEEFSKRLSGLRRTLRAVLGTTHHDYQALRAGRVQRAPDDDAIEVDDDVDVEAEAETHAPGTNGATPPRVLTQ